MRNPIRWLVFFCWITGTVSAQDSFTLKQEAMAFLNASRVKDAVRCYEQVLEQEANDFDALAFLCNYHYMNGCKVLESIDSAFRLLRNPTRMEMAKHQEALKSVYSDYFKRAEDYLVRAYLLHRNDHLDELAGVIADFKTRIGIHTPPPSGTKVSGKQLP
jgi:tetratricopeptide (TPR) repeat protein